uniref:Uncharacterized protein n=1 Tax=Glossina austeni TaxID=7395 RepID=A0A1A9V025_GLOAU
MAKRQSPSDSSKWYKGFGEVQKAIGYKLNVSTKFLPFELFELRMKATKQISQQHNMRKEAEEQIRKAHNTYTRHYDKHRKKEITYQALQVIHAVNYETLKVCFAKIRAKYFTFEGDEPSGWDNEFKFNKKNPALAISKAAPIADEKSHETRLRYSVDLESSNAVCRAVSGARSFFQRQQLTSKFFEIVMGFEGKDQHLLAAANLRCLPHRDGICQGIKRNSY